jgi:hypothetical protein
LDVKRNSVVLCYITGGSVENCFLESLVGALGFDAGQGNLIADVRCVEGLYVADNRDLAARRFMRYRLCASCRSVLDNGNRGKEDTSSRGYCQKCDVKDPALTTPDWMWFVDTDISFQSYDVLYQLLAHADPVERPIISALYFGYMGVGDGSKVVPIWFDLTPDGRIDNLKGFNSGLNRLGVAGMGCCIIHRSVFEKFGDRYAKTGWLYFGHDVPPWVPQSSIDNDMTPFGEDNCFCHRCIELGIPVYGVGNIVVEHRKKRYESMSTFLKSFARTEEATNEKGTVVRMRRESKEETVHSATHGMDGLGNAGSQPGSQANGLARSGEVAVAVRGQ